MASAKAPKAAMPKSSRARSGPSDVETRILGAALELFAERGFASTTTAEIARQARVAEKTIFAHFKSKEALFEQTLTPATVDLLVPGVKTRSKATFDESIDLETFLLGLMRSRIELCRKHPAKFRLIVQELLLRPERARRFLSEIDPRFHRSVEQAFRRFQAKGELRDLPASQLHRMVLSAILGYSIIRIIVWPDRDWDEDGEIRATVSALVNGLRPRVDNRPSASASDRRLKALR